MSLEDLTPPAPPPGHKDRSPVGFYFACALIGVAIAIPVLRFSLIWPRWGSTTSTFFPVLTVGLLFGARMIMRTQEARPPWSRRIAIVAAAAVSSFVVGRVIVAQTTRDLGGVSLRTAQLPGFSIALPDGKTVNDERDYPVGKVALRDVGDVGGVVVVTWQPGALIEPAELAKLGSLFRGLAPNVATDMVPATVSDRDGNAVSGLRSTDDLFWLSMVACGGRQLFVGALGRGSAALQRRLVASIQCTPDAVADAALNQVSLPLHLELPGWHTLSQTAEQLQIADERSILMLQPTSFDVELDKALTAIFAASGADVKVGAPDGLRVPLTMKIEGQLLVGWARVWKCSHGSELVMALSSTKAEGEALYQRLDGSARCRTANEPTDRWPAAAAKN